MTHRLHLFDTRESLASTATSFFVEGYEAGGNLLIIAKPKHRAAILHALQSSGCFPEDGSGRQRLIALDAGEILETLTRRGAIDQRLFESCVAPLVERLAATGKLWVYGEVVDLLAEQGNFAGAIRLEECWNALAARVPFTLLCGYSSAHFAPSSSAEALRDICSVHTHAAATTADTIGQSLLATSAV